MSETRAPSNFGIGRAGCVRACVRVCVCVCVCVGGVVLEPIPFEYQGMTVCMRKEMSKSGYQKY